MKPIQEIPLICIITIANISLATLAMRTFAHLNSEANADKSVHTPITSELDHQFVHGTNPMNLTILLTRPLTILLRPATLITRTHSLFSLLLSSNGSSRRLLLLLPLSDNIIILQTSKIFYLIKF